MWNASLSGERVEDRRGQVHPFSDFASLLDDLPQEVVVAVVAALGIADGRRLGRQLVSVSVEAHSAANEPHQELLAG